MMTVTWASADGWEAQRVRRRPLQGQSPRSLLTLGWGDMEEKAPPLWGLFSGSFRNFSIQKFRNEPLCLLHLAEEWTSPTIALLLLKARHTAERNAFGSHFFSIISFLSLFLPKLLYKTTKYFLKLPLSPPAASPSMSMGSGRMRRHSAGGTRKGVGHGFVLGGSGGEHTVGDKPSGLLRLAQHCQSSTNNFGLVPFRI